MKKRSSLRLFFSGEKEGPGGGRVILLQTPQFHQPASDKKRVFFFSYNSLRQNSKFLLNKPMNAAVAAAAAAAAAVAVASASSCIP